MNNKYATAVMAEQQNNFTLTNYDCDRTLFSQHDNNCLQHHVYQQDRQAYIPVHNEVPTSSSLGYIDNRITANVSRPSDLIMHEPMGWWVEAKWQVLSIGSETLLCRLGKFYGFRSEFSGQSSIKNKVSAPTSPLAPQQSLSCRR
jgi:hypothetical protein